LKVKINEVYSKMAQLEAEMSAMKSKKKEPQLAEMV